MKDSVLRFSGLHLSLLALTLLTLAPALEAAQTGDRNAASHAGFWEIDGHWTDALITKALRPMDGTSSNWQVLIRAAGEAAWTSQGQLTEVARIELPAKSGDAAELLSQLESLGVFQLAGEEGPPSYVVGVMGRVHSERLEGEAGNLVPFYPVITNVSSEVATDFAEVFVDLYDGTLDSRHDRLFHDCGCEEECESDRQTDRVLCAVESAACVAGADAALIACVLGCGGIPVCEGACLVGYLALISGCSIRLIQCNRGTLRSYRSCMRQCTQNP